MYALESQMEREDRKGGLGRVFTMAWLMSGLHE